MWTAWLKKPKLATTTTHTWVDESPWPQDTKRHKHGNVSNINILSLHLCHQVRRKGDRPAGPFFLFFLLLLRCLSWAKASAAFCSCATKISMSSRAQLRICWRETCWGLACEEYSNVRHKLDKEKHSPHPFQCAEPAFRVTLSHFVWQLACLHSKTKLMALHKKIT